MALTPGGFTDKAYGPTADYGNEKESGEGVRRAIEEGLVKREDLFITSSKLPFLVFRRNQDV